MTNKMKVPPDGGYGWVIVFAQALSNIVVIPLMQSFGLIFIATFAALGLSAAEGSLIINMNSAFGMLSGLINGVLLKVFGYRKIAIMGATLLTLGIILTSFARTFTQFAITYGLITSLGMGMSMSACSLAVNTYFVEKRGKAISWSMTVTGIGPILVPQIINFLMKIHTVQGVTLILGALSAHNLISAFLLQPVKWHMRDAPVPVGTDNEKGALENDEGKEKNAQESALLMNVPQDDQISDANSGSIWSINHDISAIYGMDSALGGSVLSLHTSALPSRKTSQMSTYNFHTSHINLETSKQSFKSFEKVYNPELSKTMIKKKSVWRRAGSAIFKFFDLDLLNDPIYVNIMIGMSLAVFAELNFSVLTAFILADFGLNTAQCATFMSILGAADIAFRFFAPYIGQYLKKPPRPMYVLTLFLLIVTRFSLLVFSDYALLLGCAIGLGVAKGVRTVYMNLVIPSYVPLEKLASASGIQMMVNGLFILIGGPLLGVVRDKTGSYTACIVIMNCVTFTTIIMWTIEAVVMKLKKNEQKRNKLEQQVDVFLKK